MRASVSRVRAALEQSTSSGAMPRSRMCSPIAPGARGRTAGDRGHRGSRRPSSTSRAGADRAASSRDPYHRGPARAHGFVRYDQHLALIGGALATCGAWLALVPPPASAVTGDDTIVVVAGTPNVQSSTGDNGPATSATLVRPRGVAADRFGNVFITQRSNSALRR